MKKLILYLTLITLFSYSALANSYDGSEGRYTGNIGLTKGWNIVPTLAFEVDTERDAEKLDFSATYRFDNERKYYMGAYPEFDFSKTLIWSLRYEKLIESYVKRFGETSPFTLNIQDRDIGRIGAMFNSAMWVYSNKDQGLDFKSHSDGGFMPYNTVRLSEGWNFLTLTPDLVEEYTSINNLKGNCNVLKAYTYAGDRHGQWIDILNTELDSGFVWFGMIIKVSNEECYLGETPLYPPLPSDIPPASLHDPYIEENINCYDGDPNNDIYTKGRTTINSGGLSGYQDMCVFETDGTQGYYAKIDGISYSVRHSCNIETEGKCLLVQSYCKGDDRDFKLSRCPDSCTGGACT